MKKRPKSTKKDPFFEEQAMKSFKTDQNRPKMTKNDLFFREQATLSLKTTEKDLFFREQATLSFKTTKIDFYNIFINVYSIITFNIETTKKPFQNL